MIPRVHTGGSFKGAGLYYLHDKGEQGSAAARPTTSARVAWTHAVNTVHDAPEAVLEEMRWTAWDQAWLKQQSGNRLDGRPTTKPVMTIALAWSPDQTPTQQDMIAAGKDYLRFMGWHHHQALFVAHRDTEHPHLHIILNRVHPETGMGLDDSWRSYRSHQWSLAYEREQGRVYCQAREGRYDLAQRDEYGKKRTGKGKSGRDSQGYPAGAAKWWRDAEDVITADHKAEEAKDAQEWAGLKAEQKAERVAFWKETGAQRKALFKEVRAYVKAEFNGEWKAYAERKELKLAEVKTYDKDLRTIIKQYARLGAVASLQEIRQRQKEFHAHVHAELKAERQGIFERQKARGDELAVQAQRQFGLERAETYKPLLARHRQERAGLTRDQRDGKDRDDLAGGARPAPPTGQPELRFPTLDRLDVVPSRDPKMEGAQRVSRLMRAASAAARVARSIKQVAQASKEIGQKLSGFDHDGTRGRVRAEQFAQQSGMTQPEVGREGGPPPRLMQRLAKVLPTSKPRAPEPPGVQRSRQWTDADQVHAEQRQAERMRDGTPASHWPAAAEAQHGTNKEFWQLATERVTEQQRQQTEEQQRQQVRAADHDAQRATEAQPSQPDPTRETTERRAAAAQRAETDRTKAEERRAARAAWGNAIIAKRGHDRDQERGGGRER